MLRVIVLALCVIGFGATAPAAADAPSQKMAQEYEKLLAQADLAQHPERHGPLAEWCQRQRWTAKAQEHQLAFRRWQLAQRRARVQGEPGAAELKAIADYARQLQLPEEEAALRGEAATAELAERRAKLPPGDAAALAALLAWAESAQVAAPRLRELAAAVAAVDPGDERANRLLGRLREGDRWLDPWDALVAAGGLKDWRARVAIHRRVAEQAAPARQPPAAQAPARQWPAKPTAGLRLDTPKGWPAVPTLYRVPIRGDGDGAGEAWIHVPTSYATDRAWGLIVYLHGGGAGGVEAARQDAGVHAGWHAQNHGDAPYVVVAPVARNHVINSSNVRENMLDVVDAAIDACERFRIDRRRIFLQGSSMGGQGVSRFSWVVPECFAGFSPWCGAYWNDHPVPNLQGKSFIVFHGEKDAAFRNKSRDVFLRKLAAAEASVEHVSLPDAGHNLPSATCQPRMLAFFEQLTNDIEPDLRLVRRVIAETVKEKPIKKD